MGVVKKVRNIWSKVKSIIRFFLTPIGHVLGILMVVAVVVIFLYVISKTIGHTIGLVFEDDYAGISTTEDYETIVGSIGYTGYDSYVSEEKWQEFAAFEYEILMDVAEHMYEYQDYVTELTTSTGEKYTTSAVFPEGIVNTSYDGGAITKAQWQQYVVNGQDGNAPDKLNTSGKKEVGGNRNVITPRLIYEGSDHEYEENAYSLMPYVVVIREDVELNYFLKGLGKEILKKYDNLELINSSDLSAKKGSIEPVRFSAELNRFNVNMPVSGYKKDLEEDVEKELITGVDDENSFVDADRDDVGYGDDVYYTEQITQIVYKIPLKLLINRYLPKSTLLTTWYMLKPDDPTGEGFRIDKMLEDIKGIYRAACLETSSISVPSLKLTGHRNEETGEIEDTGEKVGETIRTGFETITSSTVQAVLFSGDGSIVREKDGKAVRVGKNIKYASTNKRTFIYFEQFGLETSTYEKYVAYKGTSGDNPPNEPDEARPEPLSPSATYLTREKVNFIKTLNLTLPDITYIDPSGDEYTVPLDSRLKPTYTLDSGLNEREKGEKIEEKLKSNYLYDSINLSIEQDAPYAFMRMVKKEFEKMQDNPEVSAKSGEDQYKFKHDFMHKSYILAKVGKVLTEDEQDDLKYLNYKTEEIVFKLPEDFRYYNQDDEMPAWFDFKTHPEKQEEVEKNYLKAFQKLYADASNESAIKSMLLLELRKHGYNAVQVLSYATTGVNYTANYESAKLYDNGKHVLGNEAIDAKDGNYKINYYYDAVYVIEEKELEMRQNIHHRRMPALLVKYADTWSKSIEYENEIIQNSIDYRDYRYLIPFSKTSLGLEKMDLKENPHYRVNTFKNYYNKLDKETKGLKEADILDMLIQWEDYAVKGNEVSYAYMRDLYKLTIFVRDSEKKAGGMLETSYSYLYIPSTISNYDDATTQKIFWLERIGVTQGEDELNEREQNIVRYKANEVKWQNVEYDEYYECVVEYGDKEKAKVYALFPYGAPVVRAYYMLEDINEIAGQPFKGAAHPAIDISSRVFIKQILNHEAGTTGEHIYFYELNRLTLLYMRNGNSIEDAFYLAQKALNNELKEYALYSPVVAIAPGYVSAVDYDSRSGFYVKIVHDYDPEEESDSKKSDHITTFYAHFKRWPLVEVGDFVGAGTILGYEGTTGRSTGNHLHFQIELKDTTSISGSTSSKDVDPALYTTPVFSPFYYAEKAKAVLDEDKAKALGSEYYKLERTILLDDGLYNYNNVINGMTLSDGTIINYTPPTNRSEPYKSGDKYEGGAYDELIWGNNIPSKPLVDDVSELMDLNLLNQTVAYEPEDCDDGNGGRLQFSGVLSKEYEYDSNPEFFEIESDFFNKRLKWLKWVTVMMAEYKSNLVVPCYNGPRSIGEEVTDEGEKDFKAIQTSLKKAGYYKKAGVDASIVGEDTYSENFAKVVKKMQESLIAKGYGEYGVSVTGNLDVATLSAYNTMVQYTPGIVEDSEMVKNQVEMSKRTSYNAITDLSIEPALEWAILKQELGYGGGPDNEKFLALKESNNTVDTEALEYTVYDPINDKYDIYVKSFNREQGLMQISPKLAKERYEEDKIEPEDAVLYIKQPKRNTEIGMEIFKEYAITVYQKYSGDIEKAKNNIVFGNGGSEYWRKIYEECLEYETRWISPENIDRLMVYAIALEAFDAKSVESVYGRINSIITGSPSGYATTILDTFREYVLSKKT